MTDFSSAKRRMEGSGSGEVYRRLTYVAAALALVVVALGAYARLTGAGLGCPDWPNCYGQLTAGPGAVNESPTNATYPARSLGAESALNGLVHRYSAFALNLLVVMLLAMGWWYKRHRAILSTLVALLVFQALLGVWAVNMQQPLAITTHLLGGLAVLSMLWWMWLGNRHRCLRTAGATQLPKSTVTLGMRVFALVGLVLLIIQIFLGAWTSTNYAGLACSGFPTCNGEWWPSAADFSAVFGLHEANDLRAPGLIATHWLHRLGALVVFVVLMTLTIKVSRIAPRLALAMGALLGVQITIGAANVLFGLPLATAEAHHLAATLLLLTLVALNHHLNNPLTPAMGQAPKGVCT